MDRQEIDWSRCSVAELVPGRVGGAPVVKDTRLPIDAILVNYDGGVSPEEIAEIFETSIHNVKQILAFRESYLASTSGP